MLVEWSTIIRREMEIKANSAKFRMQSNPTDWEQDTLLLSELFSFFFSFLLFSLFFFFFFFFWHAEYNIPLLFFFPYIFNTVDIYADADSSRFRLACLRRQISRTINVFRKSLATNLLSYIFFSFFVFFFFCFLNIIFSKLTPPTLGD